MKRHATLLIALLTLAACNHNQCDTPFGEGGSINLDMAEYAVLNTVGGSIQINRGHKGINITRTSISDFVAFECACPNDNDIRLLPDSDWGSSILTCPVCASRFNAIDGMPLNGSVTPCPLYRYSTTFDGVTLTIY